MKIDLSELERKLSYGINLTIKESTILIESTKGFIDDKIELQEQLNTAKKALTESKELLRDINRECDGLSEPEETLYNIISQALAAIGGDDE